MKTFFYRRNEAVAKKYFLVLLISTILFFLTGCSENRLVELKIVASDWNGSYHPYEPEEEEGIYKLKVGDKVKPRSGSDFEVKVLKIEEEKIVFQTSHHLCINGEKGFDMDDTRKKFDLTMEDKELELVTPTYDAGKIYRFQILSIVDDKE